MGTIPAPNIADEAGQISSAPATRFQEYQRTAQLQQQNQLLQQQTQGAALENQKQQIALSDAKAQSDAMHDSQWDGSLDALPDLARKHGISAPGYLDLQQKTIARKTQIATLDKDSLANMDAHHNAALGVLDAAKQVPDEQLMQHVSDSVDQLATQGHLAPTEAQNIKQHAQSMQAAEFRPWLDVYEKGLMGEKQIIEQADKDREITAKETEADAKATEAKNTERRLNAEMPGGPLANVDRTELADYLKNPNLKGESIPVGKRDAATFLSWKAKQSPSAVVLNSNLLGKGDALDQAAERFHQTGEITQGFGRSPATTAAIIARSAELHPGDNLAANSAEYKANKASLGKLQTTFDNVSAFENTGIKNLDLYVQKVRAIPDLGVKFADVPMRMITEKMIGAKNYSEMQAARKVAAAEVAKVLSSANASGVLSDTQKKEAEDILDGNLPLRATLGVVDTLKQDFSNRHQSYQQQIDDIKGRMGDKGAAAGAAGAGNQGGGQGGGHIIRIGTKRYQYKGSGATNDLSNYTELPAQQ